MSQIFIFTSLLLHELRELIDGSLDLRFFVDLKHINNNLQWILFFLYRSKSLILFKHKKLKVKTDQFFL